MPWFVSEMDCMPLESATSGAQFGEQYRWHHPGMWLAVVGIGVLRSVGLTRVEVVPRGSL
jgi:hypothetical protein